MREPTGKISDNPVANTNEIEGLQQENEEVVNIPTEIEVNGKTLKVKSRTIPELVKIDRRILEFQKIIYNISSGTADDLTEEEAEQVILDRQQECMDAVSDVLFHILNNNYDEPSYNRDWIINNISLDNANKIIDIYNQKNSMGEFLKKTAMARKL